MKIEYILDRTNSEKSLELLEAFVEVIIEILTSSDNIKSSILLKRFENKN